MTIRIGEPPGLTIRTTALPQCSRQRPHSRHCPTFRDAHANMLQQPRGTCQTTCHHIPTF